MTTKQPFFPKFGSNQVLTAGAASLVTPIDKDNKQLRVVNTGAAIAYVRSFNSLTAVTKPSEGVATVADYAIPAGVASVISTGPDHDRLAYISATGTTLQAMTGEGF